MYLFKKSGMRTYVAPAKPYLSHKHMADRLKWCLEHRHWTTADWNRVIWSDESSICLGKIKGRRYVLRTSSTKYDNDNLLTDLKTHNKSVMVWGCFYGETRGPLRYFPQGSINSESTWMCWKTRYYPSLMRRKICSKI